MFSANYLFSLVCGLIMGLLLLGCGGERLSLDSPDPLLSQGPEGTQAPPETGTQLPPPVIPPVLPAATLTLQAIDNTTQMPVVGAQIYTTEVTIAWSAMNASNCQLTGAGAVGVTGTMLSGALKQSKNYTLSCNSNYGVVSQPLTVDIFGRWLTTDSQSCSGVCGDQNMTSTLGPEGSECMSGEVRPTSGFDVVSDFPYGVFPDSDPDNSIDNGQSDGIYCYKDGQKKDNDGSDRTLACFCR